MAELRAMGLSDLRELARRLGVIAKDLAADAILTRLGQLIVSVR